MNDILINEEEMLLIISKLEEKIKGLESIYSELDEKVKIINGSNEIWSGSAQQAAYEKYLTISKGYPNTVNQMKALKVFLENTLSNYINSDKKINESIENNKEELKVN